MMKHKYTFAALAAFAFMFASQALATLPAPTSATFAKGAKFTVAGYAADKSALSGFPVLVRIAENSPLGFSYNDLVSKTTGADIAFVDMNGNGLPFEIDTWNPDGTSLIWVRLPSMQNGTEFVMCWGGTTSGKTVCVDNPFADYKGVWHMNATSPADASGSSNDGTAAGNVTIAAGKIGSALYLQNKSDYVTCGQNQSNAELKDGFTVEAWANLANLSGNHCIFGKNLFISFRTSGNNQIQVTTPGKKDHNMNATVPAAGTWWHVVLTFQKNTGNGCKVYVNGALAVQTGSGDIQDQSGSTEMWLGRNQWGNDQNFQGLLDEMRLSAGIKSADWIYATYATQNNASFLTAGEATPYGATAEPQVGVTALDVQYTNTVLSVSIGSLGMNAGRTVDASWTDPLVVVGTDQAVSSPLFTIPLERVTTVPSYIPIYLPGLDTDTTYYAKVCATNSFGVTGASIVCSFTTFAANPVFSANIDMDHLFPNISLAFTRPGIGSGVTQISVIVSSSEEFENPDLTKTIPVNLDVMPTNINDIVLTGLPKESSLHYRFVVENSEGFSTVIDAQATSSIGEGNNVWSGLSEDINDPNAYVFAGGLPVPGKTLYFTKPAGLSPVINQDTEMPSLRFTNGKTETVDADYLGGFHSCGYNLSGSGVLTFTAEKPIVQASYGTNTISNPILFSRTDSQAVTIMSVGGDTTWLNLKGSLRLPDGVTNTKMQVTGQGNTVLGGASPDFMGELSVDGGRLTFANSCAMTNVSSFYFSGDPTSMSNATGASLVFPRATLASVNSGWQGRKLHLYGAPFVFPQATFNWAIRDYNNSMFDADCVVSNLVVQKNGSNSDACVNKMGTGAFIVTGETSWYDTSVKSYVKITSGCFWPAGLPPSGEIYLPGGNSSYGTLGLSGDYNPMLNSSTTPRLFQSSSEARWGFTGFGGDRTVCWNGDSSFNLTNTAGYKVETKLTNTTDTNTEGKTYDQYYAYPACFMFGNRSEYADGTIIFMNPIRYELGQNWDTLTCFESTNHVVAARMRGSLKLGTSGKTWNFSGRNFGGYLALEAENTDFTGNVNVYEKGNLLVNSNLVAQSATVQSGSGLGGTGSLSTVGGTTVKSGGALFGGEWNKGGTLTIGGKLTFEGGSSMRLDIGASNDGLGCVKLAAGATLKLTAPVYVDVITDPEISPDSGASKKVLDWSEVTFDSSAAPTDANFVARPERNADLRKLRVSVRDDGLYVSYTTVRCPEGFFIFVR